MRIDGKDLDAWAKALEVSNDAEAIAALRKDMARAWDAAYLLEHLYDRYERRGISYSDDVNRDLRRGTAAAFGAYHALDEIRRAFERHERGAA